ncbi:LamG-like jellyroll fold domain-containing protein [Luteolibacter algae]|uniref:LamG-like jellyroll fold domain-containing protein n=1 Tax=Luteolibacter algae TaxID=454151 RepID=A0ABW5D934_9BACT
MSSQELKRLIDELIDDEISEADFLRLEAELSVDAGARAVYYDRLTLNALLQSEASQAEGKTVPFHRGGKRGYMVAATAVAAVFILTAVGLWIGAGPMKGANKEDFMVSRNPEAPKESCASGFAVVSGQAGVSWENAPSLPDGALLPTGQLRLESGIAQLELFSGVTLTVEGQAEFELISSMEMIVTSGKLRAHVPEAAQGFRVHTPNGEIVDLGTEFALDISAGRSELHVIAGEVQWHPIGAEMTSLKKGQGLRIDSLGKELNRKPEDFVGNEDVRELLSSARDIRHRDWRRFRESLYADPRLVAFYDMKSADSTVRNLQNSAADGIGNSAAIVAAVSASDRWGNPGGALDFSPAGSRIRMAVPGDFDGLTLLVWVKINSLDRWYNSLFLTDGHDRHEPHWQILDDGRMFFSVKKYGDGARGPGPDKHICLSPPFWTPAMSGQWLMLATTYNSDSGAVVHFLNGEILSREIIPTDYRVKNVRIGNASIGNWSAPVISDPEYAVRNLNGSMSEFALFREALTSDDIQKIYDNGKP